MVCAPYSSLLFGVYAQDTLVPPSLKPTWTPPLIVVVAEPSSSCWIVKVLERSALALNSILDEG
jgi:hypothetical protein